MPAIPLNRISLLEIVGKRGTGSVGINFNPDPRADENDVLVRFDAFACDRFRET